MERKCIFSSRKLLQIKLLLHSNLNSESIVVHYLDETKLVMVHAVTFHYGCCLFLYLRCYLFLYMKETAAHLQTGLLVWHCTTHLVVFGTKIQVFVLLLRRLSLSVVMQKKRHCVQVPKICSSMLDLMLYISYLCYLPYNAICYIFLLIAV